MPDWAVGRIGKNTNRWAHIRHIAVTKKQQLLSKKSIKTHLQDYCENTTIHGFKYIGEKGRPMIERIWWTLVLGLAMAGSTYLISKVWYKWHDSPVFISFSATLTPVWQIPFPTVTICSETKVRQSVFNFTHATHSTNLTEDEKNMRDAISLVCDSHLTTNGSKFTDESTIDIIKKLAPQFEEMIWKCIWKTYTVHCSDLFIPVITEEGLCFSFNSLLPMEMYRATVVQSQEDLKYNTIIKSDWNLEKGYDVSAPLETKPRRAIGTGFQAGISVILRSYKYDLGYLCHGPVHGFKVLLHNPAEIPRMSERYFRVPHDQELLVPVQPNIITTSEDLRSYHPSSRQCYFPSERHLTYFKVYTQRNCEVECLTKYTLKKCQCAAIYMPRLESTSLCGAGSKQCMSDANDELKMEEIMLKMQKTETLGNTCDCLPACTSLQYEAETSQAHFKWLKLFNSYEDNMSMFDEVQLSRVSIYFKDERFITSIRNELYGVADFLAICGGLLGLFSGISVLSLIEIVYYITLRFYTNVRHQKESTEGDTASHPDVFKIDPNEKTNYDRIIVTSYRS